MIGVSGTLRRAAAAALTVALGAFAANDAHASPEDIFGYGPRASAMGGTSTSTSDDYEATYGNPALLSRIRRARLVLGLTGATFDLHADGPGLPGRISVLPAVGSVIGVDLPLPFGGILEKRLALGFAFYTPSDVIIRGRILYPETPQFPLLPDRAQSLAIRAGLGVDLGYGIRVGAGFGALAEIVGTVLVATDATGRVGSRVEDQLIAAYAPVLGASFEHALLGGTIRGGLVFRGALDARFSIDIDATKLSSINIPVFNIAGLAQYDPLSVAGEVSWENARWRLAAGLTYKRWSAYPGLIEPTIRCPADAPDCGSLQPVKLDLHDTVVPRVGVEHVLPLSRTASAAVRGGYFFEMTPTPANLPQSQRWDVPSRALVPVPTRFFDASRHVLTAGFGVKITKPLLLTADTYAQLHVLQPRTVTLEAGDGGATSTADLSGVVVATGIVLGVGF
jgi:long-chain fatty acid transport protein